MKKSIQSNLLKIASVLSIFTIIPMPIALADSIYDGIWQVGIAGEPQNNYYSITIKDDAIVIVGLNEIASRQDLLKGVYFGSLPNNIKSIPLPSSDNPLSIRVTLDPSVTGVSFSSWRIKFTSQNSASFYRPPDDYPNTDFPPPFTFKKVF